MEKNIICIYNNYVSTQEKNSLSFASRHFLQSIQKILRKIKTNSIYFGTKFSKFLKIKKHFLFNYFCCCAINYREFSSKTHSLLLSVSRSSKAPFRRPLLRASTNICRRSSRSVCRLSREETLCLFESKEDYFFKLVNLV